MTTHDLLISLIAFLSEVLGTISGFGSSTFFVPVAQLVEDYRLVLVLTSFLHVIGNLTRIFQFKLAINKAVLFKVYLPTILFTGLGAYLNALIDVTFLQKLLGFGLVIISVVMLIKILSHKETIQNTQNQEFQIKNYTLLFLSGFMTGLIGTGGALRGVALASMNLSAATFISLSSALDVGGDILRLGIYLKNGYMDWSHWYYIILLFFSAYLGASLGKKIIDKMSTKFFRSIVAFFIFLSGLFMLLN